MTPDEIAAIRARAEAATLGPWDFDTEIVWINVPGIDPEHHTGNFDIYAPATDGDEDPEPTTIGNINGHISSGRANSEFIAHARTDIPALCDELSAARVRIAELEAKFTTHTDAVQAFLGELIAVYDPCSDESAIMPVKDACAFLVNMATDDRQKAADRDARIAELESQLTAASADRAEGARHITSSLKTFTGFMGAEQRKAIKAALSWANGETT